MTELKWFKKYTGHNPATLTRERIVHLISDLRHAAWRNLPEQPDGATIGDLADKTIMQAKAQEVDE